MNPERLDALRDHLLWIAQAGIREADPEAAVRKAVSCQGETLLVGGDSYDLAEFKRVLLLGSGKAAAPMARAMEGVLGGRLDLGFVVTKYGHGLDLAKTEIAEAGHPVPDKAGEHGAERLLALARECNEHDLVLCLISGGASALTPLPQAPVTLADKQAATRALLDCGANIREINAIRKHLSRLKGGRLAKALAPATVCTLIISDVVGDSPGVIASGPTAPDESTFQDCLDILARYKLGTTVPESILSVLRKGVRGGVPETLKPGAAELAKVHNHVIANNRLALDGAARKGRELGYAPRILTSRLRGEAREAAKVLAAVAEESIPGTGPAALPVCILAGGETTVTVTGAGKGGRNQELALALGLALEEFPETASRIALASVGSDGTDGPTDAAGALVLPDSLARARELGLSPAAFLDNNDAYHFFQALDGLALTGPTRTNVMDLVILLIV